MSVVPMLACACEGVQVFAPHAVCAKHRHRGSYAAVVLSGRYDETGESGRHSVRAGEVLLHEAFEAHSDRFGSLPTRILNINLRPGTRFSRGRVADVDKIARLAESDLGEARDVLLVEMRQCDREAPRDWPDLLAQALWTNGALRITDWAEEHGLAPETVSRGFCRVFGTTPARFRSDVRARKAWRLLTDSTDSLSDVAQIAGFADQAHMTRSVVALTGVTPAAWRGYPTSAEQPASNPFKTVGRRRQ